MRADRVLRRYIPSLAHVSYNRAFRVGANALDWPANLFFPEFRKLPPNHLRIRVGVGNRILFNQLRYLVAPKDFWMLCFARGWCRLDSNIVDLGSGCGRTAIHLRDLSVAGERYTGRYTGVDIDAEMLAWCRQNFDSERFSFVQTSGTSASYRGAPPGEGPVGLPLGDSSADFVFSTSLFTHLLEAEVINYAREAFRLLGPTGFTVHTFFSIDHPPPTFGGRHTFAHRIGASYVESERRPDAAVAYEERFLRTVFVDAGFDAVKVLISRAGQHYLVAHKHGEPRREAICTR